MPYSLPSVGLGDVYKRQHLWWPAVAKLQAVSVPKAKAAAPWDRQTGGRIALFQNVF